MPTTKTGRRQQPSALPRTRDRGAPPPRPARKPARARKVEPGARRQAILDAALSVFAERGFEAARLDDVAARAGVAKGTLYLYFRDKEALFEELVRGAVSPIIEAVSQAASAPDVPASAILETFFALFQKEVLGTKRKLLLRLIIAEGPRFPKVAEFYHREVVTRGIGLMRKVAERAARQGEFTSDAAARFPQLIVAPLILAVVWDSLFARIDPLDVAGLLRAHRELLTGKARKGSP
jgi:AcrR family transcriptional regulator